MDLLIIKTGFASNISFIHWIIQPETELKGFPLYGLAIIETLPQEKVWEQMFQNWFAELKEFPK